MSRRRNFSTTENLFGIEPNVEKHSRKRGPSENDYPIERFDFLLMCCFNISHFSFKIMDRYLCTGILHDLGRILRILRLRLAICCRQPRRAAPRRAGSEFSSQPVELCITTLRNRVASRVYKRQRKATKQRPREQPNSGLGLTLSPARATLLPCWTSVHFSWLFWDRSRIR